MKTHPYNSNCYFCRRDRDEMYKEPWVKDGMMLFEDESVEIIGGDRDEPSVYGAAWPIPWLVFGATFMLAFVLVALTGWGWIG